MIVTTSQNVEGRTISEYLGVVSFAEVMMMAGGNKGTARGWQTGVNDSVAGLIQEAEGLGADAIIATHFEPFGTTIVAYGTAVRLESNNMW